MRAGLSLVALILMMPALAWGTTLRLSGEIDLLVLDGKRVSSSLLKGADSIEIDNGPHQLVLRVEKNFSAGPPGRYTWISPPLVLSFDSKEIDQVNIVLPHIDTRKEGERFAAMPQIKLVDGLSKPIAARLDKLEIHPDPRGTDYEEETQRYNKAGKKASIPAFADLAIENKTQDLAANGLDRVPSETLTEQRLKYWFNQADKSTRAKFLRWARESPAP